MSAAALDTHYEEPVQEGYRLSELANVIMKPHIGGLSYEAFHSMIVGAMNNNIAAFDRGLFESIAHAKYVQ